MSFRITVHSLKEACPLAKFSRVGVNGIAQGEGFTVGRHLKRLLERYAPVPLANADNRVAVGRV
jgi:hypothetical protein